jgi:hypothetical protein
MFNEMFMTLRVLGKIPGNFVLHSQQNVLSRVSVPHLQQAYAESVDEFGRRTYHGNRFDLRTKRIFLLHSGIRRFKL